MINGKESDCCSFCGSKKNKTRIKVKIQVRKNQKTLKDVKYSFFIFAWELTSRITMCGCECNINSIFFENLLDCSSEEIEEFIKKAEKEYLPSCRCSHCGFIPILVEPDDSGFSQEEIEELRQFSRDRNETVRYMNTK